MRFLAVLSFGAALGVLVMMLLPLAGRSDDAGAPSFLRQRELNEELARLREANTTLTHRVHLAEFHAEIWRRIADKARTPEMWGGPVVGTVLPAAHAEPAGQEEPEFIPAPKVPFPTRPE